MATSLKKRLGMFCSDPWTLAAPARTAGATAGHTEAFESSLPVRSSHLSKWRDRRQTDRFRPGS